MSDSPSFHFLRKSEQKKTIKETKNALHPFTYRRGKNICEGIFMFTKQSRRERAKRFLHITFRVFCSSHVMLYAIDAQFHFISHRPKLKNRFKFYVHIKEISCGAFFVHNKNLRSSWAWCFIKNQAWWKKFLVSFSH